MSAMKKLPNEPNDAESTLIQLMHQILERQQEKSFFDKIADNIPGLIIAVVVAAFSFYVVVQVDLTMIKEKCSQIQSDLHRIEKTIEKQEERVNELDRRIQQCERQSARNTDRR